MHNAPAEKLAGGHAEPSQTQIVKVALASFVGTAIEWYDFFLYGTAAALVFNNLFFPEFDPLVGTLAAFATYAVGFPGSPASAGGLRPLRRQDRPQDNAVPDAADHGRGDVAGRFATDLREHRDLGGWYCSSCCVCCRASVSAANGAVRC